MLRQRTAETWTWDKLDNSRPGSTVQVDGPQSIPSKGFVLHRRSGTLAIPYSGRALNSDRGRRLDFITTIPVPTPAPLHLNSASLKIRHYSFSVGRTAPCHLGASQYRRLSTSFIFHSSVLSCSSLPHAHLVFLHHNSTSMMAREVARRGGIVAQRQHSVILAPWRPVYMLHGTHGFFRSMDRILRPWMQY